MTTGDQLKLQLEVEVNSDPVVPGVARVQREVAKIPGAVKGAADESSRHMKGVGDSAEREAAKVGRVVNAIVAASQRAQAEMASRASGRDSDRTAYLAKLRGVEDNERVKEAIAQQRRMEDAYLATAKGMNNMGMSAKQLQASMRGLPAQFTDIFTSLASGQSPMMVMIQQGGQIKDMFGGLVPAVKAMSSALLSMINPWTLAAAAIGTFALAYKQGADEQQEFRRQLILTGNEAGTTTEELMRMSKSISEMGRGISQGAAAEGLVEFIKIGAAGADTLERFTASAVAMAEAGGPKVTEIAKMFADLAKDPLKGTMALNDGMNYLTRSTYEQIRAAVEMGDKVTAVKIAQDALANALDERTPKMVENLGLLEKAWKAIKDGAEAYWNELKKIGRDADPLIQNEAKLREERARLSLAERPGTMWTNSAVAEDARQRIALLEAERKGLLARMEGEKEVSNQQREQAKQTAALEWLRQQGLRYLSDQKKLEADILEMRHKAIEAKWTQLEIEKREQQMREEFARRHKGDKSPTGAEDMQGLAKEWEKAYLAAAKAATHLTAEQQELNKSQEAILAFITHPAFQKMPVPWQQAVLQILYASNAMEQANDSLKEFEKVWSSVSKSIDSDNARYIKETKGILDKARALELETKQIGQSKEAKRELSIMERTLEIQRLESLVTSLDVQQQGEQAIRQIYDRIDALKKLNDAERGAGVAEAAEAARKEWERTAESIENALTDALMRGFEKGKDFAENLVDTIKNGLKTFVAKVIIKPVMGNMINSAMGMIGFNTGSNGMGGGFGFDPSSFLGSAASNWGLAAGGAGLFGSAGAYGMLTGTSGAQAAMLASQTGVFGSAGLSATASAGGTALGGAASALMTAAPYLAAAYIAYSIWRGNKKNHQPANQNYSVLGMEDIWSWAPRIQSTDAYMGMLTPIDAAVRNYATQFGGNAAGIGYGLYTSASPNNRGAQTVAQVNKNGVPIYAYEENADNASMEDRLKAQLPRMILAGLQGSDLAPVFDDFFSQFDATRITEDNLNAILEVAGAAQVMADSFKQLAGPFEQLTWLSVEARAGILDMVGGLDQFIQKVSGYFNDFYTEEERQAFALASVDKTLTAVGLDPDKLKTKSDFRTMLEGIDTSTETGQKQYAALINSAGAFSFGSGLLENTGLTLGEITAGAPESAGVDLMIEAQSTTNSLLEKIEKAIRETGAARQQITVDVNVDQPATVEVYDGRGAMASSSEN